MIDYDQIRNRISSQLKINCHLPDKAIQGSLNTLNKFLPKNENSDSSDSIDVLIETYIQFMTLNCGIGESYQLAIKMLRKKEYYEKVNKELLE